MKSLILILFLSISLNSFAQDTTTTKEKTYTAWGEAGVGGSFGGPMSDELTYYDLELIIKIKHSIITVNSMNGGVGSSSLFGDDPVSESHTRSIMYGRIYKGRIGYFSASLGPALVYGYFERENERVITASSFVWTNGYYPKHNYNTFGMAIQQQAHFTGKYSGIGLTYNEYLSPKTSYFMIILSLDVGLFR